MFAHTLDEQIKEPIRIYIHNMLNIWEDLSEINLNEDKNLFDELLILTKECKNCVNKKCPGGYNCKFGVCLRENKICYNDLMYGKCYNMLMETNLNNNILYKCINGIHLSEKKLIPYNQRMLSELTNIENNFLLKHSISFNSKNNIISLCLNDNTINIIKDIISNKLSKTDIIDNLKIMNNLFINNNSFENDNDDDIFDDIMEEIKNEIEDEMEDKDDYKNYYDNYYNNQKTGDYNNKIIIYNELNELSLTEHNKNNDIVIYDCDKQNIILNNYKIDIEN
jgi:hypothetical protein